VHRKSRFRSIVTACVFATTVAGLVVAPSSTAAAAGPPLPSDFLLLDTPTGLQHLTDFAFLPDESILAIGKAGQVMWLPRTGARRELGRLPVQTVGDLGLTGLAVAPDFETSRTIYTSRAMESTARGAGQYGVLRLSKWTVTVDGDGAPTGLTSEVPIVETSADGDSHAINGIVAARDGTVWLTIGDSADWREVSDLAFRALDVNDLHGKLLHLRQDGTGAPDNPFFDAAAPSAPRSLVYASGFRNPFRFSLEPTTGRPIVGDVGWTRFEEVDLVSPGNSYGWPCWEGTHTTNGYYELPQCAGSTTTPPLWDYDRSVGNSVTGGVVYTGSTYPEEYRGAFFFGDFAAGKVFTMRLNERGEMITPPDPAGFGNTLVGAPVKFHTVPTGGDIMYADIITGNLRRLVYAPGNNPPQPRITTLVDPATRTVTFDAGESTDPNGDQLTFSWDFGDGSPAADGAVVTHAYAASPEQFTATLTARDPLDASATATATIYPSNHAPTLFLHPPGASTRYVVGDVVRASASATDAEDGPLQVAWSTVFVHCTGIGICHQHPGEQQSGPNYQHTFTGHPGDSHLEVTATATDSRGAVVKETFRAEPRQRRVTIQSNTPAVFTIGSEQTTSELFTVGTDLTIVAPQKALDEVATFDKWGDGNTNQVRTVRLPDADQLLTVTYSTPIDRRYATDAGLRAAVGTPVGPEQGSSTVRWREYSTGRVHWSPETGARYLTGSVLAHYLALGGQLAGIGYPTTDRIGLPDGIGQANHFQRGVIYATQETGAHEVYGGILGRWAELGYEQSYLAYPTSGELGAADGIGRASFFQRGAIYWTMTTGAHEVQGAIYNRWAGLGWNGSYLGYPTTGELNTADGRGKANFFQRGAIYWTMTTGANEVQGAIYNRWAALGWNGSYLGYPTTGELNTADGRGKANFFERGAIYWTAGAGAWEVQGSIYSRWAALGYNGSYLGYPTSGEFDVPGGRRSNFQNGYITWDAATGQVVDQRYGAR
jgi:glucose/arabinose dehydrogenase